MYETADDAYCYPGTSVLRNKLGIRSRVGLEAYEEEISKQRAAEALPAGRLTVSHYKAIHRHLFQDVYAWAGRFRTVRIHKGNSTFAYPEHLASGSEKLFGTLRADDHLRRRSSCDFARGAAHFLAELNALHPFRDGNGRCQLIFLAVLAARAGHPLDIAGRLDPPPFLEAMIASFNGREDALADEIARLFDRSGHQNPSGRHKA